MNRDVFGQINVSIGECDVIPNFDAITNIQLTQDFQLYFVARTFPFPLQKYLQALCIHGAI